MTALARYAKLEAEGRYAESTDAAPRAVVLSFGARSLVIMGFDDVAIAHWPLASLRALGRPGATELTLAPGLESAERLTLADAEMIRAIEAVCPGLFPAPPGRPPRRPLWPWLGLVAAGLLAAGLALAWPGVAARLIETLPAEREATLAAGTLGAIERRLAGAAGLAACRGPDGQAALGRMVARLGAGGAATDGLRVDVVDLAPPIALALPGGRVLLSQGLIGAATTPEAVALRLAEAIARVEQRLPARRVLEAAGTLGLTGAALGLPWGAAEIEAAAVVLLSAPPDAPADSRTDAPPEAAAGGALVEAPEGRIAARADAIMAGAGLPAGAAAPARFDPVLSDRDWVALREICAGPREPLD